jgi:hypothetical protein
MSSCCDHSGMPERRGLCPVSATPGKEVKLQTVKALLRERPLRRISSLPHRFCPDPTCEVVYFDEAGTVYAKEDVRVPVWQKELGGHRMICYCFDENEAEMIAECEQVGETDAADRVRAHIAAGRCACEIRNPHGGCCLGDVIAASVRIKEALAAKTCA